MERNRFVIELGTGVDLHGEDATEASCRAVTDAISNSCLCGLSEVVKPEEATKIEVEILIATPKPDSVDVDRVKSMAPIGEKSVQVIEGGMTAQGLMVERFGPGCDKILVANAAVTVFVCS
jgi:uncharacterized protein (TIGR02058 family)|tara:strand:+ start:9639 stop:10001 length:363 start_codon:yes stop_codon:yes gene_type:complete